MIRVTPDMYIMMVGDVLDHAQKHLNECRELLPLITKEGLPIREKLANIESLKMHLGVIRGDAERALLTVGE
ncbi:MAG: hypothetical protein AB9900_04985 [Humidesulfovibrio sp.]